MRVLLTLAICFPLLAIAGGYAPKSSENQLHVKVTADGNLMQFIRQQEAQRLELAHQLAPIKSRNDLKIYLQTKSATSSPLNKLSLYAKKRFLSSLKFNEKGLTSYEYTDLVAELSATEIHEILSLFGVQHSTHLLKKARTSSKADKLIMSPPSHLRCDGHHGYECTGPGNCSLHKGNICTSNC